MKKITYIIFVTVLIFALNLPAVAFSQPRLLRPKTLPNNKPYFVCKNRPRFLGKPYPMNFWHKTNAKIGQLVTLDGKGVVRAHGKGKVYYQVYKSGVIICGKGVVAIRGTEEVVAFGFGNKKQIDEWTFYWGKGILRVKGKDFKLSGWGMFRTLGIGKGKVTFRGNWRIFYHGFGEVKEHLEEPVELPEELESETELEE